MNPAVFWMACRVLVPSRWMALSKEVCNEPESIACVMARVLGAAQRIWRSSQNEAVQCMDGHEASPAECHYSLTSYYEGPGLFTNSTEPIVQKSSDRMLGQAEPTLNSQVRPTSQPRISETAYK